MRGIETGKVRIRHEVFTEIARLAYDGGNYARRLEELPFKIIPGEIGSYRDSLFLERAVVGERLRLAMGLPLRKFSEFSLLSDGVEKALDPEIYYEKPLINVIKFACNRCPDNVVKITNVCQGCLEHPCMAVCPRQAITRINGQAHIDQDKCIRCGRCLKECKFNAIVRLERPCRKACGMDCIHSDGLGRADIDYSKCTSCGQCMVSCPFGAISDKSQIFQTIQAVKSNTPVYVALAPAFVGQFGPEGVPERMRKAFQRLGFADVYEVAIGADLCVIEEAADFLEEVPDKHKFMVTSCCPSWSDMVKKLFPQFEKNISVAFTPMVLTARMIKRDHPDCKVVFIGPCDSKKLEARRQSVRSDVDFVLTFEEALGIFAAKGMDKAFLPEDEEELPAYSSRDARRFAYSGGVAQAVVNAIHDMQPEREVKVAAAAGLAECRKLLMMAKAGKYDGYLLEGMACPGGCIAGAGTLRSIEQSHKEVEAFSSEACFTCANDTPYMEYLPLIEEKDKIRKP